MKIKWLNRLVVLYLHSSLCLVALNANDAAHDYTKQIAPILTKYCAGCHNAGDREGGLSLESYSDLQNGGENGPALLIGQGESSRLIRVLTGQSEPKMPPEGEPAPTPTEIALLRQWIDAGAIGPNGSEPDRRRLITPTIQPSPDVRPTVAALASSPDGMRLAVGATRYVELLDAVTLAPQLVIGGLPGKVNSVSFSADGSKLITASGVAGLYGQATIWKVDDGTKILQLNAHRDTLYDAVLNPDETLLATCSYDQDIILWDSATGRRLRTLTGHNDAVYDLAFSPDGQVLASASGDETVKLWQVSTGQRLDTRSQPEGEQYVVTFSPDGRYVLAGGADNRIRVWQFVSRNKPRINPLVYSRFAHEGAIVHLKFTEDGKGLVSVAEDYSVKLWETASYTQSHAFEQQPDAVAGISVNDDRQANGARTKGTLTVARMDGTLKRYSLPSQQRKAELEPTQIASNKTHAGQQSITELKELEPNDQPVNAMEIQLPARVTGVIHRTRDQQVNDFDLFRFHSAAGQQWILETKAARQKSPLDSRIEVLDGDAKPIPRVVLQAVRDSYFTFRGKSSDDSDSFRLHNWEEMELNQCLFAGGEVAKLWHYPRGPDSGFRVYPGSGKRYGFFDTTPFAHALNEPCYIVEPHPPGTQLIPNGLPVFTINYENDDDSLRRWGADSQLTFTAPYESDYLARVTDVRGFHGEDYKYDLTIRSRQPDFNVKLTGANPTINAGSGREFTVTAERLDGYDGEIRVDVEGVPAGFSITTPLVIQAGQIRAVGTINALPDAPQPTPKDAKATRVSATAIIDGQAKTKQVNNLGTIKLAEKPKLLVHLLPPDSHANANTSSENPYELTIAPGETIMAKVRIERNDFKARVPFGKDDSGRNLPHGVYVDNIGLNGLMIVEGQTERKFFITSAKWVPEQTRMFHLQTDVEGKQTSWPMILHVRRRDRLAKNSDE